MLDLSRIRKDLHRIPEIAFEEHKTQEYILSVLNQFEGLKIHTFDFTGILVEYSYGDGPYKLFRADMDALPITEETGCDFASVNLGKMHACGHDIHMTILIGLIARVVEAKLSQNILFLFQPAEEMRGGANEILKTGVLDQYEISEAYALHVNGKMKVGSVSTKSGVFFANTQEVNVTFNGKSAHVAFPEDGRNALAAGVEFYRLVKDELEHMFPIKNKVICEFGKMTAGTTMNAIPAKCNLEGTMRAFTDKNRQKIEAILRGVVDRVMDKYQVDCELVFPSYYKEVKNDKSLYKHCKQVVADLNYKFIEAKAVFTGEDFGFFTDKYSGLLFWLGAGTEDEQDLHSSSFLPDEKAIPVGVDVLFNLI